MLFVSLILFLLPLAYSPGPGNMFFAAVGAQSGLRASWPASSGYHLATFVVTVLIGMGFEAVAQLSPDAFRLLGIAGAVYMLWLAGKFLMAGVLRAQPALAVPSFRNGAVLLVLNPKAYVIIALMFSQFLPDGAGLARVLVVTTIFTLNNLVAFTVWTMLGQVLSRLFQTERQARLLNGMFAAALALTAAHGLVT